jgi:hypothetical protein
MQKQQRLAQHPKDQVNQKITSIALASGSYYWMEKVFRFCWQIMQLLLQKVGQKQANGC